jgi:dihydroorotate dehydrogenase
MGAYERLVRPLLFRAFDGDAERVHATTLRALARMAEVPPARRSVAALCARHRRPVTVAGVRFPGLVGVAAGLDKNGHALAAWSALGFGHVELGTVTARAQPGNERPRLFRLPASEAIINRMGFNNDGAEAVAARLRRTGHQRGNYAVGLPIGVSLGKTKDTPLEEAVEDYLTSFAALADLADYVAVNVSSPNTPGLRRLQEAESLHRLTTALVQAARARTPEGPVPIFVKVAPDLSDDALEEALAVCTEAGVSGLIATNTTVSREGLAPADQHLAGEPGGLSGRPLTARAREVVAFLRARTHLPIIGVGGLLNADDGRAMLDAGADLLQIYTGYVYRGPELVRELNRLVPGGAT